MNQIYEIDSCDDVELEVKRTSKLEFKLCFDDEKQIEALLFVIPGLGADANENYREHLASFVAENFNVAVVSVNYHCIGNLPQTGAIGYLDDIDRMILEESCKALGIGFTFDTSKISMKFPKNLVPPFDLDEISKELNYVNEILAAKKEKKELFADYVLKLHVTLAPTKDEYQNFGIMQAQDLINALLYIKANPPFNSGGGDLNAIMLGSSHGGYLAHLAAKIAPYLVDGVIDNSSYAKFLWRLVGIGKEIDFTRYSGNAARFYPHIVTYTSPKTLWTTNTYSKNFFSATRRQIRYILEPSHLKIQSQYPKPCYVSYHSLYDKEIAPPDEKTELYKMLKDLNFDARLQMLHSADEIDGKFIKDLTHGMGMSMKSLILQELPIMLEKLKKNPKKEWKNKSISYPCEDIIYHFSQRGARIILECEPVH